MKESLVYDLCESRMFALSIGNASSLYIMSRAGLNGSVIFAPISDTDPLTVSASEFSAMWADGRARLIFASLNNPAKSQRKALSVKRIDFRKCSPVTKETVDRILRRRERAEALSFYVRLFDEHDRFSKSTRDINLFVALYKHEALSNGIDRVSGSTKLRRVNVESTGLVIDGNKQDFTLRGRS